MFLCAFNFPSSWCLVCVCASKSCVSCIARVRFIFLQGRGVFASNLCVACIPLVGLSGSMHRSSWSLGRHADPSMPLLAAGARCVCAAPPCSRATTRHQTRQQR
jgi:hypothetical protein